MRFVLKWRSNKIAICKGLGYDKIMQFFCESLYRKMLEIANPLEVMYE